MLRQAAILPGTLGFFSRIGTIAEGSNNRLTGILGLNGGYIRGNQNNSFARIQPANILASNGLSRSSIKYCCPRAIFMLIVYMGCPFPDGLLLVSRKIRAVLVFNKQSSPNGKNRYFCVL